MKVRELIEQLQKLDQDKMIVINGYEGGCDFPNHTAQVKINLDVNTEWYYGKHEYVLPIDDKYNSDEWNAYVLEAIDYNGDIMGKEVDPSPTKQRGHNESPSID